MEKPKRKHNIKKGSKTAFFVLCAVLLKSVKVIGVYYLCVFLLLSGIKSLPAPKDYAFDDGTQVQDRVGPFYFHRLYGDYGIRDGDGYRGGRLWCESKREAFGDAGYYAMYAVSQDGYIAFLRLTTEPFEPKKGYLTKTAHDYILNEEYFTSMESVLFDCSTETEKRFDSMNDLAGYCAANGIRLGKWYYPAGDHPAQETEVVSIGKVTLGNGWFRCSFIRSEGMILACGKVDKYCIDGDVMLVHVFTDQKTVWYPFLLTPAGEIAKEPEDRVYSDEYLAIDCTTGEIEKIDDPNRYRSEHNMKIKWIKNRCR